MLAITGAEATPPLSILQLEMSVNTTDKQLRTNLSHAKSLALPELSIQSPHDRVLALVGSGPSLKESWEFIPPDCDVMALNGAYRFLEEKGRVSKYFAMLDARECNINFLEGYTNQTTKYLLASQCHPSVFSRLGICDVEVFHLSTPTSRFTFPDHDLYMGGGGTIGLTALGLAYVLGYRRVILYGYDSSFDGDASHVTPQAQNAGQNELDVWIEDRKYRTTPAMAQQVMDFFQFYDGLKQLAPGFVIDLVGKGLFYDYIVTNNHPTTRDKELAKYVEAYKHDDYGMTQERRDGLDELIGELSGESYLDVSTGRGEVLELAKKHGFSDVRGTETVDALCKGRVTKAILPDLPFLSHSFDCVSLIEVIEHLLPEDVTPALFELTRIAKKNILISAATTAHWYGGVNLHPSASPEEEWQALFTEVWGDKVRRVRDLGQSPCWRVDL